jgi:iron complex outermembrane receptor protein
VERRKRLMRSYPYSKSIGFALACCAMASLITHPTRADQPQSDLANASLQDLMNIRVTSVSKTEQKLSQTASAIFVITQDDIARSGARNIPDLLRMVPGVDVAQINASKWAISVRGFNKLFSNSVLVLVDGRSVYTESFGGVFWDQLDMPLEDIERIEVIRGPGGSVWGANAVNGVINIITKKASETKGARITGGGGTIGQAFGTIQYGGDLKQSTQYRAFMKYSNYGNLPNAVGQNGGDGWHSLLGGLRSDTAVTAHDSLMVQGNLFNVRESLPTAQLPSIFSPALVPVDISFNISGGFIQGMWKHSYSELSNSSLEISYDHYQRNDGLDDGRGTLDINFQDEYAGWTRQKFIWTAEFRRTNSYAPGNFTLSFVPPGLTTHLFSIAAQDEIAIVPDRLFLTGGIRAEHDHYTGWNVMPSVRAAWIPGRNQTVWAAISDSVRSPSQVDAGFRANLGSFTPPGGPLFLTSFIGNPKIDDERLIAYEFGYRTAVSDRVSFDLASYYNDYDHLIDYYIGTPYFESTPPPPHMVLPLTNDNAMRGETHGIEAWTSWKATDWWTLSPGYAFEAIHMHGITNAGPLSVNLAEHSSPTHSAQLRSHVSLPHGLSWDVSAYFANSLVGYEFIDGSAIPQKIPSYTRLDSQLSWRFLEGCRLSIVGQNLAQDHHVEFIDWTQSAGTNLVKRSAYLEFAARF